MHFPVSAAHDVPRVPRRAVEPAAGREAMHVPAGDAAGGAERRRPGEGRGQGRENPLLAASKHAGESPSQPAHSRGFTAFILWGSGACMPCKYI